MRWARRLAAVVAAGLVTSAGGCASAPVGTRSHRATHHGLYAVGEVTEHLVDHSRPTPASLGEAARPDRSLPTLVMYPATGRAGGGARPGLPAATVDGPFPLILFAHGLGGAPSSDAPLIAQWAARGFVVAAPAFPLSGAGISALGAGTDYTHQPGDLSFVLTSLLSIDRGRAGPLAGLVASDEVAAVGHSLGAITVLAVGYNSCCIDHRIKAVVSIEGVPGEFGAGRFEWPHTPLLVVHGTLDLTIPYGNGQATYADAATPKYFLTLDGAPHTPFNQALQAAAPEPRWEPILVAVVTDFLDAELTHRPGAATAMARAAHVPGTASLRADPPAPVRR